MSLSNQYSVIPDSLYLPHESVGWDCVCSSWFLLPLYSLDLKDVLAESCPLSSLAPPFLVLSHSDSRTALSGTCIDILLAHHLV